MAHEVHGNGQTAESGTFSMMESILKFRILILIAFAIVIAFLSAELKNLKLTADPMKSMYPDGHPFLPALEATEQMAPEPRMLIAILEVNNGDIYNRATISKIDGITKGLMEVEGVLPGRITSLTRGITHYENTGEGLAMGPILGRTWPETEQDFERLKRKVAVNPMGPGRYVSYDGTATMITADLIEGGDETLPEGLLNSVDAIRSRERDARHNLYFMGPQLIEADMTSMGVRHVPMAAAATFLLIFLALFAYFRTLRGVLLPVVVMMVSVLWPLGMLGASGLELHPMPLVFPLILGLFSLVYAVLILGQYDRLYPGTREKAPALRAAYARAPVFASILTVGLVIVSLFAAEISVLRGLAWMGLFWLIGTVAVLVLLLPVLISFVRAPGESRPGREPCSSVAASLSRVSSGAGRPFLLGLLAVVLVVSVLFARNLEVGDNLPGPSYIRPQHPWNQCFRLMAEKFMGPYQLLVYVKAKEKEGLVEPEALNAIGDFSRFLKKQCGARDSIAFDMMVKSARNMMMDGNPKWQTVPLSREQVKGMGELVVARGGAESFIDKTFTEATISPFFPDKEAKRIDGYASAMQAYIDRNPSQRTDYLLGGGLLGMAKAINDGTRVTYWRTLAVAFSIVLVCGILITRSYAGSLAVALPIAAAQGLVWMIMVATGLKINLPAALVSALAVGFCSVFGYSQIREMEMRRPGPDQNQAARYPGLRRAGGGVLFQGVLVFVALLPWFFIGLRFPSQMVLALALPVLLMAVSSALLVPALAGLWGSGWVGGVLEEKYR